MGNTATAGHTRGRLDVATAPPAQPPASGQKRRVEDRQWGPLQRAMVSPRSEGKKEEE